MSAEDWDNTPATTNTGEAQHAWTNAQTGTKLSLVEVIETARKIDEGVAREIETSIKSGILLNEHNESYHHAEKELQKAATARLKELNARKSASGRVGRPRAVAGSSSSGRVATKRTPASTPLRIRNTQPPPPSPPPVASSSGIDFPPMASSPDTHAQYGEVGGSNLFTSIPPAFPTPTDSSTGFTFTDTNYGEFTFDPTWFESFDPSWFDFLPSTDPLSAPPQP
ncbi:hypothetical protein C8F04DRAFT_1248587 [Mycena alexandri]|uniref:Uncharacterized protein n=1 Tax=Mycena alexandri TaxID=1745969 RepID=A0AAD6TIK4_9AGAR|nr:hypothetical protein C8F04DRAFT_1248587 [Mycena alexandri]